MREEIRNSDAVVLIATTRFVDSGMFTRTFEWGNDEFALGYGERKPLLIFLESSKQTWRATSISRQT